MSRSGSAIQAEAERPPPRLHAVLDRPEIASNAGAIGRTCVAIGARLWLVRPLGFHLSDRHLKRAGLDYWEHLDWMVVDAIEEVERAIARQGGRLWSFSTKAERPYTDARFRAGDALVFGPESRGLSPRRIEAAGDRALRIPIRPEARSLNLAVAASVGLFEAMRQIEANAAPES